MKNEEMNTTLLKERLSVLRYLFPKTKKVEGEIKYIINLLTLEERNAV